MPLIKVENLSYSFENQTVFSGLSFEVEEGDYLCIFGANGSGKTTLMRCLTGGLSHYGGKIEFNGINRNNIGWLPQRTETQNDFPASVLEVVLSGFSGKGLFGLRYNKEKRRIALKNMEKLELTELKNRSFRELSGGQQQRVLLCRALCAADRVLLLDEPMASLDNDTQNELYTHIKRLHKEGMTIIMISHDFDRATKECTKILKILNDDYFYYKADEVIENGGT